MYSGKLAKYCSLFCVFKIDMAKFLTRRFFLVLDVELDKASNAEYVNLTARSMMRNWRAGWFDSLAAMVSLATGK